MRKVVAVLLGGIVLALLVWRGVSALRHQAPRTDVVPSSASATIESSGEILGVAIGSTMPEARERLDPLRVPAAYEPDRKEETGRRIYWKLKATEYDWIMAWARADGRITRVRAVLRPEQTKPFGEIGNLQAAASVSPERVRWNLQRPDGTHFRLIAQGANDHAASVYMFSLEQQPDQHGPREAAPDEEEEDE